MVDDRQHDVRHVWLAVLREVQHGIVRPDAELRARELKVALGVRGVEADGNRVEDALEFGSKLMPVLQLAEAIRVEARRQLWMLLLDLAQKL